eukprot:scaffold157155_cov51-Attheya_sp.AAC.1
MLARTFESCYTFDPLFFHTSIVRPSVRPSVPPSAKGSLSREAQPVQLYGTGTRYANGTL